jgi:hypothetical protein
MKTRKGFVSNSSSTSFVIALKNDNKPCPHCGRSDPNFLSIVENLGNIVHDDYETTKLRGRGTDSFAEALNERYGGWKDERDNWDTIASRAREFESKGWETAYIEISYHDESTRDIMSGLSSRGDLKVIWDDHGGMHNE